MPPLPLGCRGWRATLGTALAGCGVGELCPDQRGPLLHGRHQVREPVLQGAKEPVPDSRKNNNYN